MSDAKTRVAELITLFSRCRQSHNITDGCGGGKSVCTPCPYEKEHSELWEILRKERPLFMKGVNVVKPLLPDDVIRELYWDKLAKPGR